MDGVFKVGKISLQVCMCAQQNSLHFKGCKGTTGCLTAFCSRYLELEILQDFPSLCVNNDFSYRKELREQ